MLAEVKSCHPQYPVSLHEERTRQPVRFYSPPPRPLTVPTLMTSTSYAYHFSFFNFCDIRMSKPCAHPHANSCGGLAAAPPCSLQTNLQRNPASSLECCSGKIINKPTRNVYRRVPDCPKV